MNISQTMLRSFRDYLNDEQCGILFRSMFIDEHPTKPEPSEAMLAGQWFEYACTGATPRNSGYAPQPVRIKSGELNALYRTLQAHVDTWRLIAPDKARYGEVISNDKAIFGHVLTGITDVITDDLIGDIKTTAHIDNKWEQYGWGGDASHLATTDKMFQAKFYTLINYLNTGKILPFYFWVFSSNSDKAKTFRVEIGLESLMQFKTEVEWLVETLESDKLEAVPSFDRCKVCPVAGCGYKQLTPDVMEVMI